MSIKILYALGIWFIMVIVAIMNGAFRNAFINPPLGELAGHIISTIMLTCAVIIIVYLFITKTGIYFTGRDLIIIGVMWFGITVVFEFLFGHYVMGHSWNVLLADYNIFK